MDAPTWGVEGAHLGVETAAEPVRSLRDADVDPTEQKLDSSLTERPTIADRALLTVETELVPPARRPTESP
jgi:hypothetical protein